LSPPHNKPLQPSLFDETDLAEIAHPDFPGERLIVCKNPLLAAERARKREALLRATERELEPVAASTRRAKRALRGKDQIGLRVGKVLGRFKMAKHFAISITKAQISKLGVGERSCLQGEPAALRVGEAQPLPAEHLP